jgi:hypothetical protein
MCRGAVTIEYYNSDAVVSWHARVVIPDYRRLSALFAPSEMLLVSCRYHS